MMYVGREKGRRGAGGLELKDSASNAESFVFMEKR
jgi:hypothetical protein